MTGNGPFPLFWHRLGNTPAGLAEVERAAAEGLDLGGRAAAHGVELDLKWATEGGGRLVLYAHHGPTGRERLGAATVRRRAADGRLLRLDDLLERLAVGALPALIELKRGDAAPEAALAALAERLEAHGLSGARVWLAASSDDLLAAAGELLPGRPRVLFAGPPDGAGRVWHRPTTSVLRSLLRSGARLDLARTRCDLLCPIGLRPKPLARHGELAAAARAWGRGYLPGRVCDRATLEGLAAHGGPGAFVYARPREL